MRKVVHPDFPEYFVREDGFVERRVDSKMYQKAGDLLRGRVLGSGYRQFNMLDHNGRKRLVRANRLVCEAFHGPAPTPIHHAAHNNGARLDNRPDNLRWALPAENMRDRTRHGTQRHGGTHPKAILTDQAVREIRSEYTGEMGQIAYLARKYGMSHSGMSSVVHGRLWQHVKNDPRTPWRG